MFKSILSLIFGYISFILGYKKIIPKFISYFLIGNIILINDIPVFNKFFTNK